MTHSRIGLKLAVCALLTATILHAAGCAGNPKPDTSQLSPQGLRDFKADEAVLIVNDVTTGVRAAVRSKVLPVAVGAQLLTVNKQVLDVIAADPVGWSARVGVILKNGKDALPAEWRDRANIFLQQVGVIIQGGVQ